MATPNQPAPLGVPSSSAATGSSNRPLVIQTEHLDAAAAAWLAERVELVKCASEDEAFPALLARASGLVIRTYTNVDEAMLARAPKLRVVGRAGVGLDNVDQEACLRRGVAVFNTPDANGTAVVEYVACLMLDALRPRVFLDKALPAAEWKKVRTGLLARRQLCQMTLGIWGLGKIGKRIARLGAGLGMKVIYHDLLDIPPDQRHGAEPVSRDQLCAGADILTVHVDGRHENTNLVSTDAFGRMKSDVVFINTSRGFIVDPHATAEFMIAHPAATAMLDVHEPEPFGADYPLLDIANVHLSPHIAAATELANTNMSWVVRDVWSVLEK